MRNLPPLNIRYPFDPTGKSPDNLVRDELRQLPLINKRILVPTMGAFYTDSLRVRNLERDLVKGKDYELVMLYHDATVETGKEVNIGIYFSNLDIIGEVYLTYQVVGGQFTGVWEAVQQYVNVLLVDPRQVRWDDVLNKPDFYVPKEHFHDINDVYGLNALIPFLEEIRDAIMRIRTRELRRLYERMYGLENRVHEQLDGSSERIAGTINELLKDNDEVRLLKERIRDLLARLDALENNNDISDEINKLKEFDRLINNKTTQLDELKADKSSIEGMLSAIEELKRSPGLTCESIGRLPQKPWVKGTSILAKGPDGNCFRMVPNESLFQDVGIKITADKTSIVRNNNDTSQSYLVKYIVTNSGVNKNDKTQLTIVLPSTDRTPYSVSSITESIQGGDRIVKLSENIYEIYGLRSGGTATFTFRLTPEGFGSYQLGGQVDVFSEYDTNTQNNTSSIILSSSLPITTVDENYIPSVDCPRIIGQDLITGNSLKPLRTYIHNTGNISKSYIPNFSFSELARPNSGSYEVRLNSDRLVANYRFLLNNINLIDLSTDSKAKIKLENASSIVITQFNARSEKHYYVAFRPLNSDKYYLLNSASNTDTYYTKTTMPNLGPIIYERIINPSNNINDRAYMIYVGHEAKVTGTSINDFEFDPTTSLLTINNANGLYCISCRPGGENCNWQSFVISTPIPKDPDLTYNYKVKVAGLSSSYYKINRITKNTINPIHIKDVNGDTLANIYNNTDILAIYSNETKNYSYKFKTNQIETIESIVINIPRGTEANFTLYLLQGKSGDIPVIKGNVDIIPEYIISPDRTSYSTIYNEIYIKPGSGPGLGLYKVDVRIKSTATSTDNFNNGYIKINII